MKTFRTLTLRLSLLLTAATAAGCGTQGLPGVAPLNGASIGSITAQGIERKLGFDLERYEQVIAPQEHPQHLTHRGVLPTSVDNRKFCSPVADQGKLGSCTAFAMGKGMREFMAIENSERKDPLSALFLYYEERALRGTINQDSGATITDGMRVLTKTGIATEVTCPYDILQFKIKPSAPAYSSAAEFKIHDGVRLADFEDIKTALAQGQSVPFGFRVYESFRKIGADGVMPIPTADEKVLGGHAVLAVGYDDQKQQLIVRNSWSEKWGDHGYFYMPYEIADSGDAHDWWTASK